MDTGLYRTFLIGLSLGGGCLAHCGPALLPLVLSQGGRRVLFAALFLCGRLAGYLVAALAFTLCAQLLGNRFDFLGTPLFGGIVQLLLAGVLVRHALAMRRDCGSGCSAGDSRQAFARWKSGRVRFALQGGFLTGLGFCAPMLALAAECATNGAYGHGIASALAFYAGTSAVLVPVIACGILCRGKSVASIGFYAALLAAALYLWQALILFIQTSIHD
ncbi:MAG TPA: sulfite exporter TauE/SafE family protein [Opitutales bacterium]|nr:sulfite exporter TauE/SafE family protein [Opitutales bacterium]